MKTIEEIKNEVAVKHGYQDWKNLFYALMVLRQTDILFDSIITEAMQLYAKQMCIKQIALCSKHLRAGERILTTPLATEE